MYNISVSNGILTSEHKKRMGSALWEFLWCLDKMTRIDSKKNLGIVLGGKPVKLSEIGMGHDNTVSRNMAKLEKEEYIKTTRTPYGMVIYVVKPKKFFNRRSDSLKPVIHQKWESPTGNGESPTNNGDYKEDNTVDNTVDNNATIVAPLKKKKKIQKPKDLKSDADLLSCEQFIESCRKSPQKHIQVIAEWAEAEQPTHTTRGEWKSFITRNLRAARLLSVYTIPKIEKAYQLMLNDVERKINGKKVGFITKYSLETIAKYIDRV